MKNIRMNIQINECVDLNVTIIQRRQKRRTQTGVVMYVYMCGFCIFFVASSFLPLSEPFLVREKSFIVQNIQYFSHES